LSNGQYCQNKQLDFVLTLFFFSAETRKGAFNQCRLNLVPVFCL
jgi:hypothetical protein